MSSRKSRVVKSPINRFIPEAYDTNGANLTCLLELATKLTGGIGKTAGWTPETTSHGVDTTLQSNLLSASSLIC
jgi:hypothetical protein